MIEGNLEEIEVEERSNGVIRNCFETLPRITVLSLAVLSTVLDFYLEISIGSHTNTVTATQKKSPILTLSVSIPNPIAHGLDSSDRTQSWYLWSQTTNRQFRISKKSFDNPGLSR